MKHREGDSLSVDGQRYGNSVGNLRRRWAKPWPLGALLTVSAMVLAACGSSAPTASNPVTNSTAATGATVTPIHFSWGAPTATYIPMYVAEDLGFFKKVGLYPTFYSFQSGAPLLAGLKAGSLDVVTTGIATVFALGQHIPLKFLVWSGQASAAEKLVVQANSQIRSVSDLSSPSARAGTTFAAATGTCAQTSLYWAAQKAGVSYSQLHIVNVAPPLYADAFRSGSLTGGVAWAPYAQTLQQQGYKIVGGDPQWEPDSVGDCPEMMAARSAFLTSNPQFGDRLIQADAMALAAIKKNPQVAVDALMKHLSLTQPVAQAVYSAYFANYPSLQDQVNPSSPYSLVGTQGLVQEVLHSSEAFAAMGVIPAPLSEQTVEQSMDPTYIEQYLKSHGG